MAMPQRGDTIEAIKRRAAEKKAAEEKKKAEARVCAARCRLKRCPPINRNRAEGMGERPAPVQAPRTVALSGALLEDCEVTNGDATERQCY